MPFFKCPPHSSGLEKAICDWITLNTKNTIDSYSSLTNGFILTEILSKIDPNRFDIRQLWKLRNTEDPNTTKDTAFSWNNLSILEGYIKNCWLEEQKKNIFDFIDVDFTKIYKEADSFSIHQLVSIIFLTVVLLSKNDGAFEMIQSIHNLQNKSQSLMANFAEDCVFLYSQFVQESRAESSINSPARTRCFSIFF